MPEATLITPDELAERMRSGAEVVPLDVRRGSYERSDVKVKGALRVDPAELEEHLGEAVERISSDADVVAYCT